MTNAITHLDKLKVEIDVRRPQIEKFLPKHMSIDRFVSQVHFALGKSEKLRLCTPASVVQSVLACAELGLDPSGRLGSAYLVPFKGVCTLIPGYRGLIDLARRSGDVSTIECRVVRKGDVYDYWEDENGWHLKFIPSDEDEDDRPLVKCFAIGRLINGHRQFEAMSRKQIEKIMARSPSYRSGGETPWKTDFEEMARKTVVRRLVKYLPLSPEKARDLARALELDADGADERELNEPPPAGEKTLGKEALKGALKRAGAVIEKSSDEPVTVEGKVTSPPEYATVGEVPLEEPPDDMELPTAD